MRPPHAPRPRSRPSNVLPSIMQPPIGQAVNVRPAPAPVGARTAGLVVVVIFLSLLLAHVAGLPAAHGADPGVPVATGDEAPVGTIAPTPAGTGAAALEMARGVADGAPGTRTLSPQINDALGYTPGSDLGRASDPHGDCSTPVPLPARFEIACRVHDLGYDLLRVAHRDGAAIPPGLRADLDTLLITQWHQSCDGDAVRTLAAKVAGGAVRLNTLRQHHGAPVEERWPW